MNKMIAKGVREPCLISVKATTALIGVICRGGGYMSFMGDM